MKLFWIQSWCNLQLYNALITANELVIHSDLQLSKSQWRQEQRNYFSLK